MTTHYNITQEVSQMTDAEIYAFLILWVRDVDDAEMILAEIMEKHNCQGASMDFETGDIWIADPQRGHWLSGDDRRDMVAFIRRFDR